MSSTSINDTALDVLLAEVTAGDVGDGSEPLSGHTASKSENAFVTFDAIDYVKPVPGLVSTGGG